MTQTPEEAALTGQLNLALENTFSSVKIIHKVEMKTGKTFTEWEVKAKHQDVNKAYTEAVKVEDLLQERYK